MTDTKCKEDATWNACRLSPTPKRLCKKDTIASNASIINETGITEVQVIFPERKNYGTFKHILTIDRFLKFNTDAS